MKRQYIEVVGRYDWNGGDNPEPRMTRMMAWVDGTMAFVSRRALRAAERRVNLILGDYLIGRTLDGCPVSVCEEYNCGF